MLSPRWMSPMRRVSYLGCAVLLAAGIASAQSTPSQDQSSTTGYSSSQAGLQQFAELALPSAPAPGASASGSGGSAAGQYGSGGGEKHGLFHNYTFEAGGGFNAPIGGDIPWITWGGNFTLGVGLRFSKRFSTLFEYQFMDDKLPGPMLASYNVQAGNAHINALTGSPVFDLFPKRSYGIYLVGGWGFYHKSTNLQDYEEEESFYGIYDEPVTVASITSNQWGGNAGFGLYHKMGSMYGDSHTELFAEARYTFIHTPPLGVYNSSGVLVSGQTNGLGTTELIPVTLGVRF